MPAPRFTTENEWTDFFDRLDSNRLTADQLRSAKESARNWENCPAGIKVEGQCPVGYRTYREQMLVDLYDIGIAFMFAVSDARWRDASELYKIIRNSEFEYFGR
ncbi:MAG: hypothetical protein AAFY15_01820 [Cyanobacteria bacterium J06648_11]